MLSGRVSIAYPRFTDFARVQRVSGSARVYVSIAYPRFTDFALHRWIHRDIPLAGFNRLSAIHRLRTSFVTICLNLLTVSIAYPRFTDFAHRGARSNISTTVRFNRLSEGWTSQ